MSPKGPKEELRFDSKEERPVGKAKIRRDCQAITWLRKVKKKEEGKCQFVLSTWDSTDDSFIVERIRAKSRLERE